MRKRHVYAGRKLIVKCAQFFRYKFHIFAYPLKSSVEKAYLWSVSLISDYMFLCSKLFAW